MRAATKSRTRRTPVFSTINGSKFPLRLDGAYGHVSCPTRNRRQRRRADANAHVEACRPLPGTMGGGVCSARRPVGDAGAADGRRAQRRRDVSAPGARPRRNGPERWSDRTRDQPPGPVLPDGTRQTLRLRQRLGAHPRRPDVDPRRRRGPFRPFSARAGRAPNQSDGAASTAVALPRLPPRPSAFLLIRRSLHLRSARAVAFVRCAYNA